MKWTHILLEEMETIINIDYQSKIINIYTNNQYVYRRIFTKFKNVDIKYTYINGDVASAESKIKFSDRINARLILTMRRLIGENSASKSKEEKDNINILND